MIEESTIENTIMEEAEKIKEKFLEDMPFYYGLAYHSKNKKLGKVTIALVDYLKVKEGRLYFFPEGGQFRVLLGNIGSSNFSEQERINIAKLNTAHETSHFLHAFYLAIRFGEESMYNRALFINKEVELSKELVGEIGTHLFFRKRGESEWYRGASNSADYGINKIVDQFFSQDSVESEETILKQISKPNDLDSIMRILSFHNHGGSGLIKCLTENYLTE